MSDAAATVERDLAGEGLVDGGLAKDAAALKVSASNATNGHDRQQAGDDSDSDSDGAAGPGANGASSGTKKKKKKKKAKRKKGPAQSSPPRVPVSQLFPSGVYPEGERHDYLGDNSYRTTSEEKRHLEKLAAEEDSSSPYNYQSVRHAAEVHRQVRQYARANIKPGMGMAEIADMIEDGTRALTEAEPKKRGIGFPTGLSLNHCAAHYTPNHGDTRVLQKGDMLKVDIGVQINGRIVDSAFTLNFNDHYDELLQAVRAATETGVREAGIDARLAEIGEKIQETMESYEVEIDGKLIPIKAIENLSGHDILPHRIHGRKTVPLIRDSGETAIMEEGDYFAIETFGSTGTGRVDDEGECSHYSRIPSDFRREPRFGISKKLLGVIDREFGTLPFCKRYLDRVGQQPPGYYTALQALCREGFVQNYPPLCDREGSMTAQFEHTIFLRPTCKEVVSRGDDY